MAQNTCIYTPLNKGIINYHLQLVSEDCVILPHSSFKFVLIFKQGQGHVISIYLVPFQHISSLVRK